MIVGVADTHAALWLLFADKRLSAVAGNFSDQAAAEQNSIAVSLISLVEIVYLIEKSRVPANAYDILKDALADQEHVFTAAPLTVNVVESLRTVSRESAPDLPDRIIAPQLFHLECLLSPAMVGFEQPTY